MSVYSFERTPRRVLPSPLFLVVLAVTAVGGVLAWQGGFATRSGRFGVFLFVLGGWVVSVCLHEFAHAYLAYRAGDRSVEARGYLTLNPFKYAHPVLSLLLPAIFIISGGIGLPGGAVYLHRHQFRSKAAASAVAAAGPIVNLIVGATLLWTANSHVTLRFGLFDSQDVGHLQFWSALSFLGFLQITAAVLNLLPVPGLDGWSIIEPYLSPELQRFGDQAKQWGLLAVIVLLTINSLNDAFFRLVDHVYNGFGGGQLGRALGYELFRFWTKSPFGS